MIDKQEVEKMANIMCKCDIINQTCEKCKLPPNCACGYKDHAIALIQNGYGNLQKFTDALIDKSRACDIIELTYEDLEEILQEYKKSGN